MFMDRIGIKKETGSIIMEQLCFVKTKSWLYIQEEIIREKDILQKVFMFLI